MLPGISPRRRSQFWITEYLRRLTSYAQMDFEYTFWQMFYLCFNPSRVYRTTSWHRQTKNQWARDDPAFVAILIFFLTVASLAYGVAFKLSILGYLKLIFWSVFFDFISLGIFVATIGWWISNKYLRILNSIHAVDQTVEWLYAFDIHCNSFFPLFLMLHVVQFFLVPLLLKDMFISTFLSNTMYLIALGYYWHITFLGYHALPFLQNTRCFLYPAAGIFLGYFFTLIFNFNVTIFLMNFYFS
eukprot:TRINITY_DN11399_c0_g1_i1.p1 TRINITY_DN11399_c0_g1~~TRINITY_DN11399_c0_g1_i1.p1  ORF type:complete len:243 (-),score=17.46 TRINITY_DN11399_c0_g1_i1:46-774(-)